MSGHSYEGTCPKCGESMDSYMDWKPYDVVNHQCLNCGFYAYTKEDQLSLVEVNDLRLELDLEPLVRLKEVKG